MASVAVLSDVSASHGRQIRDAAPRENFLTVNGVKLHYADWGGSGETVLFLMPNGGNVVRQFAALAPPLTDRFHVIGLTRRGLAPSEKPASGYDTTTLVRDIVAFLDVMGIQRVNLIGHYEIGLCAERATGMALLVTSQLGPDRVKSQSEWSRRSRTTIGLSAPNHCVDSC